MSTVQARRSPSESIWLHFLLNLGYSQHLLAKANIRNNEEAFGRNAIRGALVNLEGPLACEVEKWPTKPNYEVPGKSISSVAKLIEMSLLTASMYHLYGERIYENLTISEVTEAWDMYVNVRQAAGCVANQITPDTAYFLSREFITHCAAAAYCPTCEVRYYTSSEQRVKNGCPYCREAGIGDHFAPCSKH